MLPGHPRFFCQRAEIRGKDLIRFEWGVMKLHSDVSSYHVSAQLMMLQAHPTITTTPSRLMTRNARRESPLARDESMARASFMCVISNAFYFKLMIVIHSLFHENFPTWLAGWLFMLGKVSIFEISSSIFWWSGEKRMLLCTSIQVYGTSKFSHHTRHQNMRLYALVKRTMKFLLPFILLFICLRWWERKHYGEGRVGGWMSEAVFRFSLANWDSMMYCYELCPSCL